MATEDVNITEESEMAECDGDKVVTMMDVLQEQQNFEEDANAVLGASDDKNCTYVKGYIKRQALYACLTCCPDIKTDPTKRAGICLACSLNCHENHELVELYTKRNFRCDCGNPKFTAQPCHFNPNKPDLNTQNVYNQNYSGLYCVCQRPYPDPSIEDDMIQCIICEDWLHASHLEAVVPGNDQYSEMICKACMNKNDFLHDYSNLAVNVEIVDIITVNGDIAKPIANTEDKTLISNGDVDMTDAKDECIAPQDKTKSSEEEDTKPAEPILEDRTQTDDNMHTGSENQEPDSTGTKDTAYDANKDYSLPIEDTNKNRDITNDQKEVNEKLLNNVNLDSEITDQNEPNIVEIQKSTTDNPLDKSLTAENTKDGVEKPTECDKSDASSSEQTVVVKSENIEAYHAAQESLLKNNEDGKSTSSAENGSQENTDQLSANKVSQEANDVGMGENETKQNKPNMDMTNQFDSTETKLIEKTVSESSTDDIDKSIVADELANGNVNEADNRNKENSDETKNDEDNVNDTTQSIKGNKRKLSIIEECSPKKVKLDTSKCERPKGVKKVYKGATFWPSNFREKLCTCGECITMYKSLNVLFLTDLDDTVSYYESLGKANVDGIASQYEKGLQALSSLDRIQQINALTEYNKMRDKLVDFLKSFKDRKEIVKEEDIKAFFAGMKPRRKPDGVYFCR